MWWLRVSLEVCDLRCGDAWLMVDVSIGSESTWVVKLFKDRMFSSMCPVKMQRLQLSSLMHGRWNFFWLLVSSFYLPTHSSYLCVNQCSKLEYALSFWQRCLSAVSMNLILPLEVVLHWRSLALRPLLDLHLELCTFYSTEMNMCVNLRTDMMKFELNVHEIML